MDRTSEKRSIIILLGIGLLSPFFLVGGFIFFWSMDSMVVKMRMKAFFGDPYAEFYLGQRYQDGFRGKASDPLQAAKYFSEAFEGARRLAEKGDPKGEALLAHLYDQGE